MGQNSLDQRIKAVENRLEDLPVMQQEDSAGLREELSAILAEIREAGEALRRQREEQGEVQMANDLQRSLLDVMPVGVIVCDGDGTILMNNPAAQSILDGGLAGDVHHPERAHTTYRPDGSLFPVEEMPLVQALGTGQVVKGVEILVRWPDGRERAILAGAAPVTDDAGDVVSGVAIFQDITARKQTEEEIERLLAENRSQRELLERLINGAPIGIAIVRGPDHLYEMVNPHYQAFSGMLDKPIVGRTIAEVFPDIVTRGALEFIETVYRTGQTVSIREREASLGPGCEQTYWSVDHVPLCDQDGDVESVLILSSEVTEQVLRRKQVEELAATLQSERNILQVIMENTRAHLAYLDPEFNFVEANSTYVRGCGHSREELIGHNHFELFPHEENQAIFELVRDTGEPAEFRAKPFEFPDHPEWGTTYWDWTLTPVKDENGEVQGLAFSLFDVTEQMRTQTEIENLSRFPSENPNPVLRMAKDGTILYANAGSAPLLSWCDAQVGQKGPDDWRHHSAKALDTGEVRMIEVPCDERTFLLTIVPIVEKGYANLYGLDITEREQAEQALYKSEQKLRALFEILPIGVSVLDDSRNIRLSNPALAQILDLSQEQLLNGEYGERTYLRVDGSEMTPDEFPSSQAFREQQSVHDVEIEIVKQDGEQIWTCVNAVPLPFDDWRVILTTANITGQKQAEMALRQAHDELELRVQERTAELVEVNETLRAEIAERQRVEADLLVSEERFRQVAENIDKALWLAEPETGQLLYINPAYEEIWGRSIGNLPEDVDKLFADVHPEDREQLSRVWEGQEIEFRIIRPDDKVRWVQVRSFPIYDDSGRLYRLAGIAKDISEQKQTMNALLYAEQLAVAGKMAASLAHEINNPLQAAIGCLGLGQKQLEQGENAHDYLEVTAEALQRTSRIVEQLRTLHQRAEPQDKEIADLNVLLEKVLILTQKKCGDSDVEVVWVATPDLPALELMPDAMHQVFLNLILNAVEAMPEGGRLLVHTSKTQQPSGVEVQFTDEGIGIPSETLARLFEPFYTTKTNSLGLGLFISQSIVQQHGGHIEVQSQEGKGATFTIWLPS